MSERKFSHAAPPWWHHEQTSIPDVRLTVGKGSIALEWALEDRGRRWKPIWLSSFFFRFSPQNMIDGNLVFPRPPDDIINKRAYPTLDLMWGRGLSRWNGRWMMGGSAESQFDCRGFFSDSPLKNMMDGNLVFPCPPDDNIKQTSVPDIGLTLGKGSIALEWALDDGGQRWNPFDCRVFVLFSP